MSDFVFDFTEEQVAHCLHRNDEPSVWYEYLATHLPEFDITSPARVAGFIAQTQHESLDYTVLQENLNYSAQALTRVFPKYFNPAQAAQYARKPEMIANRVYANRMGNGPEKSGDGWKYRGRGILQVTGKNNYTACSMFLFGDDRLVHEPDMLLDPEFAVMSACWYWTKNNLNSICDAGDVVLLTKRINGGTIGLEDRVKHWNAALELFENAPPVTYEEGEQ